MKKLLTAALLSSIVAYPAEEQAPPFDTPAPIAFMKDLSSDAVLYAKQPDKKMPPASLAKMMTVYVAFTLIGKGELKQDQKIHVSRETWQKWHSQGSTMFLSPDEDVSVENLLYGIVTLSGNDACVVLAEGISGTEQAFTALMNQQAQKLGMTNSHFGTSNGWPDEGKTYVTARDLATLAEATIEKYPDLYKKYYSKLDLTWGKTAGGSAITQANRDPLLGYVDGADGLKTGHTEEAGYGFTGSAIQNGRRLVMVLAGLDTYNGRAQESRKFMNWGFRAWKAKPLVSKGKRVAEAEVQQGSEATVGLVAPRDLTVTVPSGTSPEMTGKIIYQGPIKAPITKGQHIADLIVNTPGMGPQKLPLVAEQDVGQAGFFGRAWAGLMSLFG